jgi:uncharacterized protein YhhL (DUF1145 family)
VNQELAKEGIPLPFGNRIWAANWPTQNAPFPGLIIHLITTVSELALVPQPGLTFVQVIVVVAPPLNVAYPFILDLSSYPIQIIDLFVILVRDIQLVLSSATSHRLRKGSVLSPLEKAPFSPTVQRHFYSTIP